MVSPFKQFQTGQRVSITDLECGCQLSLVTTEQPGHDIIEIGRDYLVVEDAEAGIQTRIPRHMIFTTPPVPAPMPLAQSA